MSNVYEVKAADLVKLASQRLKEKNMKKPGYVDFVKSGPSKERVPHEQGLLVRQERLDPSNT